MRFATITTAGRRRLATSGPGQTVLDVAMLLGRDSIDMETLIAEADALLPTLRELAAAPADDSVVDMTDVRWLAPCPRPSKIVGVAINNVLGSMFAHRTPTEPAYFLKPSSALVGHGEAIVVAEHYGITHPEPELAAVIGTRVRSVDPDQALAAVFGYTIINDITSPGLKDRDSVELVIPGMVSRDTDWRELRGEDDHSIYLTYHARSKGTDTFAPMGPWLVTRDEVPEPNMLAVECRLDDVLVLTDSTANLRFSVGETISHLSRSMTLEPGDVVHFGTAFQPAAPERFPTIRHLDMSKLEGTLSVEIEGIGRLDNPIARP